MSCTRSATVTLAPTPHRDEADNGLCWDAYQIVTRLETCVESMGEKEARHYLVASSACVTPQLAWSTYSSLTIIRIPEDKLVPLN